MGRLTACRLAREVRSELEPARNTRHYEADIVIESSLWPAESRDSLLILRWSVIDRFEYDGDRIRVTSNCGTDPDWHEHEGVRALWFLDKDERGAYEAAPNGAVSLETDLSARAARLDFIVRERYSTHPAPNDPEPWKADPRLERVKVFLDETIAGLAARNRQANSR